MLNKISLFLLKASRKSIKTISKPIWKARTHFSFLTFGIRHEYFTTNGIPFMSVSRVGEFTLGMNFRMKNNFSANIIGKQQSSIFIIKGSNLNIKNNVAISSIIIVCHNSLFFMKIQ